MQHRLGLPRENNVSDCLSSLSKNDNFEIQSGSIFDCKPLKQTVQFMTSFKNSEILSTRDCTPNESMVINSRQNTTEGKKREKPLVR